MSKPTNPPTIDKEEELRAQQSPVKILVFSGGGAKGAIYSGVVEALDESGVRDGVSTVAGASAGAITAALTATGISKEEFKRVSEDTDFQKELLGKRDLISAVSGRGLYDGSGIEAMVNSNISKSVGAFFQDTLGIDKLDDISGEIQPELLQKACKERVAEIDKEILDHNISLAYIFDLNAISDIKEKRKDLEEQRVLLEKISKGESAEFKDLAKRIEGNLAKAQDKQTPNPILFSDLKLLIAINPKKFKDLVVNATRKRDGEMVYFDCRNTPNVEIAKAVHASCSIPGFFKAVEIEGRMYVDGGVLDNVPVAQFQKPDIKDKSANPEIENITNDPKKSKQQGRMLAFAFGSNDKDDGKISTTIWSMKTLKSPGRIAKFLVDTLFLKTLTFVGGLFSNMSHKESGKKTQENLRKDAASVIALDTGAIGHLNNDPVGIAGSYVKLKLGTNDVDTLNFGTAHKKAKYLHTKGKIQTERHLANHSLTPSNPSLDIREFLLSSYERATEAIHYEHYKAKALLSFCEEEKWAGKDQAARTDTLQEYITACATNPIGKGANRVNSKTNTVGTLIAALNHPTTSSPIKSEFMDALGIAKTGKDIQQYKFSPKDLDKFLTSDKCKTIASMQESGILKHTPTSNIKKPQARGR